MLQKPLKAAKENQAKNSGEVAYLPELLKVNFVSHQHHRDVIGVPDAINEFLKLSCFLKGLAVCDGIADNEAFSTSHILVPHGCEFCLQNRKNTLSNLANKIIHL